MSKSSRTKSSEKRKKAKASKKAEKKALYLRYAAEGRKTGSKRAKMQNKKKSKPNKHCHVMADCGNIGCHKCYPATHNMKAGERIKQLVLTAVA